MTSCFFLAALKKQREKLRTIKTSREVFNACLTAAKDWDNSRPKKQVPDVPQNVLQKTLADYVAEETSSDD